MPSSYLRVWCCIEANRNQVHKGSCVLNVADAAVGEASNGNKQPRKEGTAVRKRCATPYTALLNARLSHAFCIVWNFFAQCHMGTHIR